MAVLASLPQLSVDQVSLPPNVAVNGSISIAPFIRAGHAFLSGLGIIMRRNIYIHGNLAVGQGSGDDPIGLQHVDVCGE